jgi:hypothetical protein
LAIFELNSFKTSLVPDNTRHEMLMIKKRLKS